MFYRMDVFVEDNSGELQEISSRFVNYTGEQIEISKEFNYQEYMNTRHEGSIDTDVTIYDVATDIFDSMIDEGNFSHLSRGTDSRNRKKFNANDGNALAKESDVSSFLDIDKLIDSVTVKLSDAYICDI